ncbi:putative cytochrome P450 [Sphingomonas changbaiensis NBRC 104936]|uniref:Putative cytochrome P450 n=1 Tax=Sphingomonas changbaiensis NBRC 104936 TaxID=1219043 RepID=A0A0E9MNK7_9SPHN|nr:cytochrome P450 [Sphingomonas changbaiensis]GAO38715.1 putative cytochrome P450 [Sphingomonas changbaiensis NBRC 104936]
MTPAPWSPSEPPDGFFDDPFPFYRQLREEAPIARASDGSVLLSRHADLSAVYRDAVSFSSDKRVEFAPKYGDGPLFRHHTTSLVFNDDPYHGRVRKRLVGALTPRALAALAEALGPYCEALLDRFAERGGGDAVESYAAAVPVRVIGDMLGVPEADRGALRGWSLAILGALEPQPGPERLAAGNAAVSEFSDYLDELIEARRRAPGDPERDLLTRLIAGEGDEMLTPAELIHNAIFLLNAGHETTSNLIGSALYILATMHDVRRALIADPEAVPSFVEEVLRFESPNQLGNRRAVRDAEIAGVPIAAGTQITLVIGAANRDPAAFAAPETFDVRRAPNRHLAFGAGPHQCAGLSLARIEARIAIAAWLRRFPEFGLAGHPHWQHRVRFRGLTALDVAL